MGDGAKNLGDSQDGWLPFAFHFTALIMIPRCPTELFPKAHKAKEDVAEDDHQKEDRRDGPGESARLNSRHLRAGDDLNKNNI